MSNLPTDSNQKSSAGSATPAGATPDANDVAFKSSAIGVATARKQDHFAEQNRKAAEKKVEDDKTKKKVVIIAVILGALLVIGLLIWLIVWIATRPVGPTIIEIPDITTGETQEVLDLRDAIQETYNQNGDLESVEATFDDAMQNSDSLYQNQILLSKIMFYVSNSFYDKIYELYPQVDENALSREQQSIFYNIVADACYNNGDTKCYDKYMDLTYQISQEIGGEGGN